MASSAFDILEGNEIVTWTNTIIDYSRKMQKAEKGKLSARVGRKARGLLLGIRSWRLDVGHLNPTNSKNSRVSEGCPAPSSEGGHND